MRVATRVVSDFLQDLRGAGDCVETMDLRGLNLADNDMAIFGALFESNPTVCAKFLFNPMLTGEWFAIQSNEFLFDQDD